MALIKNFSKESPTISEDYKAPYTLEDLRNDDEFVERAERYLKSLDEGESVADMYQYFRGSDFNIGDTGKVALQASKFTDEQKGDYSYLRTKFDGADVGGFREKKQLTVDATQEILSDPLNYLSAFLIPWSGGTSLIGRAAGGEATKQALKGVTNLGVRQSVGKVILNTPGQVLKGPLTTKQLLGVASAEGMIYGGTHDYVNQSIDLTTDRRDERSLKQTALAGTIGAVAAPAVLLGIKGISQTPKWVRSVNEQRISRIDNNENYKSTYLETTASSLVEGTKKVGDVLKLTALPMRPTSFLRKKAKENKPLQSLLKLIRYDAMEGFMSPAIGKQEILKPDYDILMRRLWGQKTEKLSKIFRDNKLLTSQNRFNSKDRRDLLMNPGLSDEVNDNLAYVIRSGKTSKVVNGQKIKIADNIIKAGKEIRKELDDIYNKSKRAGLNPNRADNYFPRMWRVDVIKKNKKEFIDKIIKGEKATPEAAEKLWLSLTTEGSEEGATTAGLKTRLLSERILTKINDADFGKFLNNDVESVLKQYYTESAALITRTKLFGETEADFITKWIEPIKKAGLNLSKEEELYLKTLYGVTTGQKGRINRNRRDFFNLVPTGKIGAGVHDTLTVTMQTSMLGLSTLTSFAEIGVPLLLGNETIIGSKAIVRGIVDSGGEWWRKQKQNFGVGDANIDIRSANRQDLNSFMSSVNLGAEDRAVAIYGQAVGKTATKIQNFFFKSIGLHDWTRFVQLVGYDMGKNLIYKNLKTLSTKPVYPIVGVERKAIQVKGKGYNPDTSRLRIEDELRELGINVEAGINWINRGALHTDRFFMQDVRGAANRYTNEVVMNPTAASAQKPLIHSLATTKWAYGLMGFPTAFSNGPLRKVVRNITRDAKTISSGGARVSSARAATGAIFMTNVGLLNYTLRTGGQNWKDLESGKITEQDMIERSLQYAGILGPAEMYIRYTKAKNYESKFMAALGSVTGPNTTDMIDYLTEFTKNGTLAETALKRAPFSMSLKSLHREKYNELLKAAREIDDTLDLGPEGVDKKEGKVIGSEDNLFSTGGLVKGKDNVPQTKEDPADRVNPVTGKPYSDQMARLGFNEGGELSADEIILMTASEKRGWTPEESNVFRVHKDLVGWTESDNIPTRTQGDDPRGTGRGKYQVEMDSLRREAAKDNPEEYKKYKDFGGSSSVYVNRYKNFKEINNIPLTEREIELFKNTDLDFSKVPEDLQDAMFYTDKLMKENFPVNDLVKGKLSHNDAWYKYHYAGTDESKLNLLNERVSLRDSQ